MNTQSNPDTKKDVSLEEIVSLCKRRGFIYQGSEIYGGLAGTFDYGPLGSLLKNNIKDSWIKKFVKSRRDMYLVDAAILMSQKVWQATGHVDGFNDPLVDDLKTGKRYRADHLLEKYGFQTEGKSPEEMTIIIKENNIKSPDGNELSQVRQFNLMLQTSVGAAADSSSISYLRPETAQGMFVNFKNVIDSFHPKMPFGMAQIGKAFRNEITPKNFLFRLRELEQMEIEYFVKKEEWEDQFEYWRVEQQEWLKEIGIDMDRVHENDVPKEDLAHYSDRTIDLEFDFPFGRKELTGLAYRTDYDLSKHSAKSGVDLVYLDPHTNEKITPHVIEPTFGLDRVFLTTIISSFCVDKDERVYLDLPANIAPYKVAVSPLLKNKPELVSYAEEVFALLKEEFGDVVWDSHGNIGKRYRRQDEIGTPFCVVIDFDSLENGDVTVRNRNTTEQVRVDVKELVHWLKHRL